MITQLPEKDRIIAEKLEKLGFFHHPDLHRSKPPKSEACHLSINSWHFANGIAGVWAFRDGEVFLSNKVTLTERLKLQIFEIFKSVDKEVDRAA